MRCAAVLAVLFCLLAGCLSAGDAPDPPDGKEVSLRPAVVRRTIEGSTVYLEIRYAFGGLRSYALWPELVVRNESGKPLKLYWGGEAGRFGPAHAVRADRAVRWPTPIEGDERAVVSVQAVIPAEGRLVLPHRQPARDRPAEPLAAEVLLQFGDGAVCRVASAAFPAPGDDAARGGGIRFDWTVVDGAFHLEVKNDGAAPFLLHEYYREGYNLTVLGYDAGFRTVYETDFEVEMRGKKLKPPVRIAPGEHRRRLFRLEKVKERLPAEARYIRIVWDGNPFGAKLPEGGLPAALYALPVPTE